VKQSYDLFLSILQSTKNIMSIYNYCEQHLNPPIDYSDLLRWQWVQAVSALDKYVHDIVRIGMLEIYSGKRQQTKKYLSFSIDIKIHSLILINPIDSISMIEQQILMRHSHLSFQDPDNLSDALSYIWNEEHKWEEIAKKLGLSSDHIRKKLKNIAIRRNQIAHQGDYPNMQMQRLGITKIDVEEVIDFIEKIGCSIFSCIKI